MSAASIRYQVSKPVLAGREQQYVLGALQEGWISSNGRYIERFEAAVSAFLGMSDGMSVCNGTTALHLACLGMQLEPGCDVIVPALTYIATANAVAYCGARPVFADVDPTTWNVTRETVEAAWTPRTVGVVVVHLYGLPCPVPQVAELCKERGAWLIEDCAESFGAEVVGRTVGGFGDAAAFSFYGNKIISTGEGGMVFVRDSERRRNVKMLKGQGMDKQSRYWHPIIGYNYRMTNLAAAIGLAQVEMADYHLAERRRIAMRYSARLRPLEEKGLVRLPVEPPGYRNVYWLFSLVLEGGDAQSRARLQCHLLEAHGIETRPFFVPMHQMPMYGSDRPLPCAEFLGSRGISLPTYSGLRDEEIDEISVFLGEAIARELQR